MQSAFLDNWVTATGEIMLEEAYLPRIDPVGNQRAQIFTSAPGGGTENVQFMYLMSIASARSTIRLSMAYFIPDNVSVRSLVAARERGVRVQIILPGQHIDRGFMRRASRFEWGPLLRAGVEIYEYQTTMYHCKVLIVDDFWTSVGLTNFDSRSFSVNDEANLNVADVEFAREQARIFASDLQSSRQIRLSEWENPPWSEKALDALAGTLSSQLSALCWSSLASCRCAVISALVPNH